MRADLDRQRRRSGGSSKVGVEPGKKTVVKGGGGGGCTGKDGSNRSAPIMGGACAQRVSGTAKPRKSRSCSTRPSKAQFEKKPDGGVWSVGSIGLASQFPVLQGLFAGLLGICPEATEKLLFKQDLGANFPNGLNRETSGNRLASNSERAFDRCLHV
jgi:hypothetical protein